MNPQELAEDLSDVLLLSARGISPKTYRVILAAVLARMAIELSDDYWQEMKQVKPCGDPTCDCHLMGKRLMRTLDKMRSSQREYVRKRRGFSRN